MAESAKSMLVRRRKRANAVDGSALVNFSSISEETYFPLLCQPEYPGVDLIVWAQKNLALIESKLDHYAAILFRGFSIRDIGDFNQCVDVMSGGAMEYLFRASPRTQIKKNINVYSSTDYPPEESIFPHNEHSYSPIFPLHLYLYCDRPPESGGETPLGDNRQVLAHIEPSVKEEFVQKGVLYVRNYGDGMGLPWQTVFQTESREDVESYCRKVGIEPEWKPGNRLRTRQRGPAVVRHPRTHEIVWFNHGTFFNALTLPESIRTSLCQEFAVDDLPQNTYFGDGSEIPDDYIFHLQEIYRSLMVEFSWRKGDVVLLDNILAVHGRNTYGGERRILTAMAIPLAGKDVVV